MNPAAAQHRRERAEKFARGQIGEGTPEERILAAFEIAEEWRRRCASYERAIRNGLWVQQINHSAWDGHTTVCYHVRGIGVLKDNHYAEPGQAFAAVRECVEKGYSVARREVQRIANPILQPANPILQPDQKPDSPTLSPDAALEAHWKRVFSGAHVDPHDPTRRKDTRRRVNQP